MQGSGNGTTAPTRTSSPDKKLLNWTSPGCCRASPCPGAANPAGAWRFLRSRRIPLGAAKAGSSPRDQPPPAPTPGLFIDLS